MRDNKSDFLSKIEFDKYYRLDSIPETSFLAERECFKISADTTDNTRSSEKGIMIFALGSIAAVSLFSMIQLCRSLNITPAKFEITSLQKTYTSNKKTFATAIPVREFNKQQNNQK